MLDQQIPNIPWRQLTTPYGRGTAIPQLIEQEQYTQLADLIEHQGTLWQVTPWVLLILLKSLKVKNRGCLLTRITVIFSCGTCYYEGLSRPNQYC